MSGRLIETMKNGTNTGDYALTHPGDPARGIPAITEEPARYNWLGAFLPPPSREELELYGKSVQEMEDDEWQGESAGYKMTVVIG